MPATKTAQEIREERNKLVPRMEELRKKAADHQAEWTEENENNWKGVCGDYDALSREMEIAERLERAGREQEELRDAERVIYDSRSRNRREDENRNPEADRELALTAWFRCQVGELLEDEHREACERLNFNPQGRELRIPLVRTDQTRELTELYRSYHSSVAPRKAAERLAESRALSAFTGTAGGYTVPDGFVNQLEINMLAYGGMLQVSEIMRTAGGGDMPWPTANDTSNSGAQIGENTAVSTTTDPTFAQVVFHAYKFTSNMILVPVELMQDAAFNLGAAIGAMLGERLGRISNTKFTTGTGAATPKGIVTAATLGVTAASATAIAADEIFDLIHSVDPAYRTGARFMLHDNILLALRKLKDGEGRYLWSSGLQDGVSDSLAGFPLTINQDMASAVTTTLKTILFGQLNKYKVRQVADVRFRRLTERYADTDQEGFVAFLRQDGNLLDAGTAPVKYLQQA